MFQAHRPGQAKLARQENVRSTRSARRLLCFKKGDRAIAASVASLGPYFQSAGLTGGQGCWKADHVAKTIAAMAYFAFREQTVGKQVLNLGPLLKRKPSKSTYTKPS